jgi:hypothetical protein
LSGSLRSLLTLFIQFRLLSLSGGCSCGCSFSGNSFSLNSCCKFLGGGNALGFSGGGGLFCGGLCCGGLLRCYTLCFSGGCGALCLYPLRFSLLSGILRCGGLFCSYALGFGLLCCRLLCGVAFCGNTLGLGLLRGLICGITLSSQLFS